MKKIFLAALLAVTVAAGAFAADTKKVNDYAVDNFKSDFRKATNVSWTVTGDYAKARFTMDNQTMEAFYNQIGEIIATSKNITLDELPVRAKRSFAKKFVGYTVKEAIRFEGTDEGAYYISAENDQETVILKVSDNSDLSTYRKTKK